MLGARKTDERTALIGAAAKVSIGRARVAADFSYGFAANAPLSHPPDIRPQRAFGRINRDSNEAFEIGPIPNGPLGGDGSNPKISAFVA